MTKGRGGGGSSDPKGWAPPGGSRLSSTSGDDTFYHCLQTRGGERRKCRLYVRSFSNPRGPGNFLILSLKEEKQPRERDLVLASSSLHSSWHI